MGFIKKTLFLFIAVVAFFVALLAAADNSEEVALKFLAYETPVWPISWWMLSAFIVGVAFGNLLNVISNIALRIETRRERTTAQDRAWELGRAKAESVSTVPVEI